MFSLLGIDPTASNACEPSIAATVLAAHAHDVAVARPPPLARAPLSRVIPRSRNASSSTDATSASLIGSTCWRDTSSVTCEPERVEQVRELDAGDAGTDHDRVLGDLGRRVRRRGS